MTIVAFYSKPVFSELRLIKTCVNQNNPFKKIDLHKDKTINSNHSVSVKGKKVVSSLEIQYQLEILFTPHAMCPLSLLMIRTIALL